MEFFKRRAIESQLMFTIVHKTPCGRLFCNFRIDDIRVRQQADSSISVARSLSMDHFSAGPR